MTNMGGKPVGTEGSLVLFSEQNSLCLKPFDSGDDYQNLSSEAALFFILIIWFTNCQLFPPKKTTSNTQSSTPQAPRTPPSPPWQTGPFGFRARLGRRLGAARRSHGARLRGAGRGALLLGHGEAGAGGDGLRISR